MLGELHLHLHLHLHLSRHGRDDVMMASGESARRRRLSRVVRGVRVKVGLASSASARRVIRLVLGRVVVVVVAMVVVVGVVVVVVLGE